MARFKVDAIDRNGRRSTYEFDLPPGIELTHLQLDSQGQLVHPTGVAHRLQSVHHGQYDLSSLREVEIPNATPIIQEVEVIREVVRVEEQEVIVYRFPNRVQEQHWDANGNTIGIAVTANDPTILRVFVNGNEHAHAYDNSRVSVTVTSTEPLPDNQIGFNISVYDSDEDVNYDRVLYVKNRLDT